MKRIFLLLAFIGIGAIQSCEGPDGPPGPAGPSGTSVEAEVFEIRNVDFQADGNGFYGILYDLEPPILNSDMILVYRLTGSSGGADIWESLPKTYYFTGGEELDYNFDFTMNDISIYLDYTNPIVLTTNYTDNQVFRVVIIPGYLSNKVDTTNFNEVKAALKLTEKDFTNAKRN